MRRLAIPFDVAGTARCCMQKAFRFNIAQCPAPAARWQRKVRLSCSCRRLSLASKQSTDQIIGGASPPRPSGGHVLAKPSPCHIQLRKCTNRQCTRSIVNRRRITRTCSNWDIGAAHHRSHSHSHSSSLATSPKPHHRCTLTQLQGIQQCSLPQLSSFRPATTCRRTSPRRAQFPLHQTTPHRWSLQRRTCTDAPPLRRELRRALPLALQPSLGPICRRTATRICLSSDRAAPPRPAQLRPAPAPLSWRAAPEKAQAKHGSPRKRAERADTEPRPAVCAFCYDATV